MASERFSLVLLDLVRKTSNDFQIKHLAVQNTKPRQEALAYFNDLSVLAPVIHTHTSAHK